MDWKLKRLHWHACMHFIYEYDSLLTEGVDVFPNGQGEGAARVVNTEEDHGHVLGGTHASPQ